MYERDVHEDYFVLLYDFIYFIWKRIYYDIDPLLGFSHILWF